MAIPDYETYLARIRTSRAVSFQKDSQTGFSGLVSMWRDTPGAGAIPVAAVATNYATIGALPLRSANGMRILLAEAQRCFLNTTSLAGADAKVGQQAIIICDRLSHQAGLNVAVAGLQTTNLPTAALTRFTDGVGVMVHFEIWTGSGASTARVQVNYTNDTGGASVSPVTPIFVSGTAAGDIGFMPLAAGDRGVRAVNSVTVTTTSAANNFGVTLFRPLLCIPCLGAPNWYVGPLDALSMGMNLPTLPDDACLYAIRMHSAPPSGSDGANITLRIGRD